MIYRYGFSLDDCIMYLVSKPKKDKNKKILKVIFNNDGRGLYLWLVLIEFDAMMLLVLLVFVSLRMIQSVEQVLI